MGLKITKEAPAAFVWRDFDDDVQFLINPLGLVEFRIILERFKRFQDSRDKDIASEGLGDKFITVDKTRDRSMFEVQSQSVAHHIIKGWGGDIVIDGQQADYTPETAYDLLISNPAVFTWAIDQARQLEMERALATAETVGKPQSDSRGNSNGAAATSAKPKQPKG